MKSEIVTDNHLSPTQESQILTEMIRLYCRKKHGSKEGELCSSCQELLAYCLKRLSFCPFGEKKGFCSACPIHCYDSKHREEIRKVMRYSGPRMIFHHPLMLLKHFRSTHQNKKKRRCKK